MFPKLSVIDNTRVLGYSVLSIEVIFPVLYSSIELNTLLYSSTEKKLATLLYSSTEKMETTLLYSSTQFSVLCQSLANCDIVKWGRYTF